MILSNNGNSSQDKIVVKMVPFGPSLRNINSLTSKLLNRPKVRSYLKSISREESEKTKKNKQTPRLLSVELLPETAAVANKRITLPKFYLARYYDYENNYCLSVKGKLGQRNPTEIIESKQQPLPNDEEFEEALRILSQSEPSIGESIQNNILKPYRPMPPLLVKETPDGDIERTLCVGLLPADSGINSNSSSKYQHEIVAVNMINKAIARFDNRAPANSRAEELVCGSPDANQPTAARGTPGSAKVTVTQGNTLL